MSYGARLARFLVWSIFKLTSRIAVEGFANLPAQGGYVIVSNHIGRLDAPLVFYLLERQDIIMLVAEKYRDSAIYRWLVRQLDAIWVDRFNADFSALRAALKRLRQGGVLVIAPEGTRSPDGTLGHGQPGASYLAAKAGVPVVPVALTGTEDQVVKGRLRRLQRLSLLVRVGQPFSLPPLSANGRDAQLAVHTTEMMCQIAALLPPERRGVYASHPRLLEILAEAPAD